MLAHLIAAGVLSEADTEEPADPADEPVSLAIAKLQLKVDADNIAEDGLIAGFIKAAREWVENEAGRVLVRRSFTEFRNCFGPYLEVRRRPIVGGTIVITYSDVDNQSATYSDPVIRAAGYPVRIYPALNGAWPPVPDNGEVLVTYQAGYEAGEVPQQLIQAILILLVPFYERRADGPEFEAAKDLCNAFRAVL